MLEGFDDLSSIHPDEGQQQHIENRLWDLQAQNKQLKQLACYQAEVQRLNLELNYAQCLKSKYHEMYKEVSVQVMQQEAQDSLIFGEDGQIGNSIKKIEILTTANEGFNSRICQMAKTTKEIQKENLVLKQEKIPELLSSVDSLTNAILKLEENLENKEKRIGIAQFSHGNIYPQRLCKAKPHSASQILTNTRSFLYKRPLNDTKIPTFLRKQKTLQKDCRILTQLRSTKAFK